MLWIVRVDTRERTVAPGRRLCPAAAAVARVQQRRAILEGEVVDGELLEEHAVAAEMEQAHRVRRACLGLPRRAAERDGGLEVYAA
eukprot:SAG31_NODE_1058_length_10121_cov_14.446617_10_plen_86_part_00